MHHMLRRNFIRTSGLGVTALSASRVMGANDRLNLGLIGCGGRGRGVARSMREAPNVAYVAVADVYKTNADAAREWAGTDAKAFQDFRKLLELKEVDAVHIATPDHWHAIASVLACQAGKDVYVEKPTSLTIREGRAMVNAARKHNRIVQVGTQHRSAPHFMQIAEMIQRGDIGPVKFVRVWNYANHFPNGIGKKPVQEPFAIVGSIPMIAVDPDDLALRILRDEIIAPAVATVPPSRLDTLRAIAQDPGFRFELGAERSRFAQEPDRARWPDRHRLRRRFAGRPSVARPSAGRR